MGVGRNDSVGVLAGLITLKGVFVFLKLGFHVNNGFQLFFLDKIELEFVGRRRLKFLLFH